ncbi:MAG: T9SS type A sorting domain-containing protein [Candidatus Cloacimonetes bacterium]|nr:T9SS type A sorting domain-containing protein [Candidatus Cloacimonadota bacterium]
MKKRIIFLLIVLCIWSNSNFFANESLAQAMYITLYSHVTGQAYQRFLNDYSQYQLRILDIVCDECLLRYYFFDKTTIDVNDFLSMIQNDSRVYLSSFLDDWRVRTLAIKLSDDVCEADFINSYSHIGLNGSVYGMDTPSDYFCFTFDDNQFYPGEVYDMMRNDERVIDTMFSKGWKPGDIIVNLDNWVVNEAFDEFLDDFSHIEFIEISQISVNSNTWLLSFSYLLDNEFLLYEELRQDYRVRGIMFNYYMRILHPCSGPISSSNDETLSKIEHITVYPNPARFEEVIIKMKTDDDKLTEKSPETLSDYVISIYNIRGQLIKTSKNFQNDAGEISFIWDLKDQYNQRAASGTYFFRIKTKENIHTGRLTILK